MKSLPQVRHNIIANFVGRAWTSVLSLAFIPLYIKLMGVEVYGLLGVFMSLGALLSLLDMGLSSTLSRELSRLSTQDNSAQETRNLVRTFELVYWGVGATIGVVIAVLAKPIATYWISSTGVTHELVENCLVIMGLSIAFQWPGSLYSGGLMGLQRQIALNAIRSIMAIVQHGGAVIVLVFVSPSILSFFSWQALVGLLTTITLRMWLWKHLPEPIQSDRSEFNKAVFSRPLLLRNWRFATGVTGISLTTIILTQLDKIILSKMLTLQAFGYYMLAFNVANALHNLVTPLVSALYPRFTQLIAANDTGNLIILYHKGCQLLSVIVLPVAITIAFFSEDLLTIWLGSGVTSQNTHQLLTLLIIGTAMNALVALPYSIQLAYGWTRLAFFSNVFAVTFLTPLMIWLVARYQGVGAGWAWIVLNSGYFIFLIPIMHRRLLRGEMGEWYRRDVILPAAVVFVIALAVRLVLPIRASIPSVLLAVIVLFALSAGGSLLMANHLNRGILKRWKINT